MKKSKTPEIDNSLPLRPVVRETMQMMPHRRWTEALLFAQIRAEYPDSAKADVGAALDWNFRQGYVKREFNHQFEQYEWFLTAAGKDAD